MTRSDNRPVTLQERPVIANSVDADLFVSVHNNALPDGVDPRTNNGVSAYYYHPHSSGLARCIHEEMLLATGLPDHGWYHGNLSVIRPTQYPAVLVECDFQILPEREAALKTAGYRRTVARAITRGIERFLEGYDGE
jgi:N-acetylmuramoyl-L-alanine amidase